MFIAGPRSLPRRPFSIFMQASKRIQVSIEKVKTWANTLRSKLFIFWSKQHQKWNLRLSNERSEAQMQNTFEWYMSSHINAALQAAFSHCWRVNFSWAQWKIDFRWCTYKQDWWHDHILCCHHWNFKLHPYLYQNTTFSTGAILRILMWWFSLVYCKNVNTHETTLMYE